MGNKVIIACILFILGSSIDAGKIAADSSINGRDLIQDALELLKKFQDAVGAAVSEAVSKVIGLLDEINEVAQKIENDVMDTLVNATKDFVKQIEALEEEAGEAAVDISICVGDSIKQINDLPSNFIQGATECLANKTDEAKSILDDTINAIKGTMDVVLAVGDDIEKCEKEVGLEIIGCLGDVTTNITTEIVELPMKIAGNVAHAVAYVATVIPLLNACEAGQVAKLTFEASAIVANVTGCANELLKNN